VIWFAARDPLIGAASLVIGFLILLVMFHLFRGELAGGPAWSIDLSRGELTVGKSAANTILVKDIRELRVKKDWRTIDGEGRQCAYTVYVVLWSDHHDDGRAIAAFVNWNVANECAAQTARLLGVDFQPV
jgi:hypothetical protein